VESYNAVPIVRDVLKAYFDKKERQAHPEMQMTRLEEFVAPGLLKTAPFGRGSVGEGVTE
jgi:hypothetical protein